MADSAPKIRFIPSAAVFGQTQEDKAALVAHRLACGYGPGAKTPEHQAHADQVQRRRVGWNGAPIYEMTCPACGIRWRTE